MNPDNIASDNIDPDDIGSEANNPDRTYSNLKHAREILQRRSTRAAKLQARKDALRLYISALPKELLGRVFANFLSKLFQNFEARNSLAACSLVCRRWARLAQLRLHQNAIFVDSRLSNFHRTLKSSDQLGGCVRQLTVFVSEELHYEARIPVDQMIAECLERTPNLKLLYLHISRTASLTDVVIERLQLLPRLERLHLNQQNYLNRPVNTSGFNPALLRFLPSSVEKLCLARPFLDLVRALPDVLQRIYPSQPAAQAAGADPNAGLKTLEIAIPIPRISNEINLPTLISETSITATLTTLVLRLMFHHDNSEQELWNNFIGSCHQLEDFNIGLTLFRPSMFRTMPPLGKLRVLAIIIMSNPRQDEWEAFSDSIVAYVAQTPALTDFSLNGHIHAYTQASFNRFLYFLLAEFYTANGYRLRSLSLGNFSQPTLGEIEDVGPEEILRSSLYMPPSFYMFELLCMRATRLEHLEIAVPLPFLSRVTSALAKLKHLRSLNLHNYPLIIDPAVPLKKMKQYKHFLYCCKLMKQHMRLAAQA